jgi:hypothetical protein
MSKYHQLRAYPDVPQGLRRLKEQGHVLKIVANPTKEMLENPRALAGRLRRAQTFLRALGIEIVFSRDGRLRTRTITITAMVRTNPVTPSAPSSASATMDMARV